MRSLKWIPVVGLLAGALCLTSVPKAEAFTFGITPKVGTLGAGIDGTFRIMDRLNIRAGLQGFPFNREDTIDDVDYDLKLRWFSVGARADFHPFNGSFRVTGGFFINNNAVDLDGKLSSGVSYEIGDTTYTGDQLGSLKATIDFPSFAPYVGIGWGNAVKEEGRVRFACDLGVMFQGSPEVSLKAQNPLGIPGVDEEVQKEEEEIQSEFDSGIFKIYPLIEFGISIRI